MASGTSRTIRVRFDGDSKGLAAAAKDGERSVDKFGKSVDKKFRDSGDRSGKGFAAGLKKWFGANGGLAEVGKSGGTVFGSGLLGALKTPVLGPAILAVLAGAVAVAAPAAGAIAAAGLVTGFGAGLAGLGLVFAAKSKVVQDTWKRTLDGMGKDMTTLSKPFEATLVSIAGFAQRTFDKFKPSLEAVFKELAPVVTKFADQISRGLEQLQPAIRPISEAFTAVLDSLGPAMQGAIGNVSKGLQDLAASVKANPDGLADLASGLGSLTRESLQFVAALNDAYAKLKDIAFQVPLVEQALTTNDKAVQEQGKHWANQIPIIGAWLGILGIGRTEVDKTTTSVGLTGNALGLFTQGLNQSQVAAVLAGTSTNGLALSTAGLTAAFNAHLAVTQAENAALHVRSGLLLSLSGSEIAYQAALDDATASVKENGRTLDINTAKGRANKTALDQVATSANAQTDAMRSAGDGNVAAANHGEAARAKFVKLAQQMGATVPQAKAMAKSMIDIPNVTRTARLQANKKDLETKLAQAQKALKDPDLTKTREAKLKADIANAKAGIATINSALGKLPSSKTINITTNTYKNLIETHTVKTGAFEQKPRASGGLTQPNRSYLVGERGPELLTMGGSGGRITSNEKLGSTGGGEPIYAEIHIEIGGEVVRVVRSEIKADNKALKRKVNAGVR